MKPKMFSAWMLGGLVGALVASVIAWLCITAAEPWIYPKGHVRNVVVFLVCFLFARPFVRAFGDGAQRLADRRSAKRVSEQ